VRAEAEKQLSLLRSQISLMLPHEMRTPLNGIISNAELLADSAGAFDAATIADMSRDIRDSGQRLERLIENFLIYAQLEIVASDPQSTARLRTAVTDHPQKIIREAADAQGEKVGRIDNLLLDLGTASLAIAPDYFKKIVEELIQNALKFSDAGSCVRVYLKADGPDVFFSVQDEGRGFSTEQIDRIGAYMQFERKMQDEQGFGMGLAIAKKLVELHGGELAIESAPGVGSTVTVKLPASPAA